MEFNDPRSPFGSMYRIRHDDVAPFGEAARLTVGGDPLPHAEPVLCAVYEPPEWSDGHRVDVYVTACPARFFELRTKAFKLGTGSGVAGLAHTIAQAIAEGMLDVELAETVTP